MSESSILGKIIKDTYQVDQYLGEGGPSVVYKGTDLLLGRPVAIKMLKAEISQQKHNFTQRFLREARVQSELIHQNIVAIRAVLEEDGHFFIVMEYVDGGDLEKKLLSIPNRQLTFEETDRIFSQILDGLGFAHSHEIIHRDIKPSNILLTNDGCVKIADFGLARHITDPRLTKTGFLVGTILYMSPEQLKGEELDWRTDLYSVGIMLYEALAGRHPFTKDSTENISQHEIFGAHLFKDPPPIEMFRPDIPFPLKEVVEKSVLKNREERFQSAEEFKEALKAALNSGRQGIPSAQYTLPPSPSPSPSNGDGTAEFSREPQTLEPETTGGTEPPRQEGDLDSSDEGESNGSENLKPRIFKITLALSAVVALIALVLFIEFFLAHKGKDTKENSTKVAKIARVTDKIKPADRKKPELKEPEKLKAAPPPQEAKCPQEMGPMEWIPTGEVMVRRGRRWEKVKVPGFCLDRREVLMDEYSQCVDDGVCEEISLIKGARVRGKVLRRKTPLRKLIPPNSPWQYASWEDAQKFCRWAGKRLPTELEWLRAARADKKVKYPWGDSPPTCEKSVFSECSQFPLGEADSRNLGASPFGILDMSGNLAEWTSDCYSPSVDVNPKKTVKKCLFRTARGGAFKDKRDSLFLTTFGRKKVSARNRFNYMGVRCAYTPQRDER